MLFRLSSLIKTVRPSSFLIGSKAAIKQEETAETRAIKALRDDVAQLAAQVQRLAQSSKLANEPSDRSSDAGAG